MTVTQSLTKFIGTQNSSQHPPKFLIYDVVMPLALDIARQLGLVGAPFFTQSGSVNAIYNHAHRGAIKFPLGVPTASLPSMPPLGINDLPSFMPPLGINDLPSFMSNTGSWRMTEYGLNLFKPNADACMKWLDKMETGSVIYAAFGSLVALGEEQMEELTMGLKNSSCHFLWVVRETEQKKLPINFVHETSEKGLVVSWCPQLKVLAHKAIGCFMTRCGWNSTLEALSLGGKVGVRIKVDQKGFANKEEIELCIREVMEGESRKEMKRNSVRLKELAIEAMDEGGILDKNIEEFVEKL
uniref:UDP-glycosyltransferases domain-containing protein n=1 Tax=Fagus sylvatica TaxID=28930 RepID=A0A2N9JA46_FAGSY